MLSVVVAGESLSLGSYGSIFIFPSIPGLSVHSTMKAEPSEWLQLLGHNYV